ncbi:MAG: hypothetical protein U0172_02900 [Nitrospiraceae bacterium]
MLSNVAYAAAAVPGEYFCRIQIVPKPQDFLFLKVPWWIISFASLTAIPAYIDESIYISYELYRNEQLVQRFKYEIQSEGIYWLGAPLLTPFVPSDWALGLPDNANRLRPYRATAELFLQDAHAAGLL